MSLREGEGLISRIRQMRRGRAGPEPDARPPSGDPGQDELGALAERVTHLEQLVEGLQDSVHRESSRLTKRLGDLEARTQPAALGRVLSEDARERGL